MTSRRLDEVIQVLEAAGASLRCDDMRRHLESLGFEVRDGKKQGHKIVTHPHLEGFYSTSYTCGHGKNPEIKPPYVRKVRATLRNHYQSLSDYLGGE
ncbi:MULTISPECIES: type II toxin-antitoxin system HicA family toxin [unclassified Halorhodospira]|uniref:type II toxin-antitoxin system HicA family toxin n=1 Tax=unclassified Halorhodospira TaxID=2626748 RepID=UPI001EE78818|nr:MULTISPECIES: type II toxin-antitoxin system HicA family toxin [unclassified Halorhodospira]MCG5541975.1 type II toxin-antitoxin system HicA family toxin [Halorhodospira sp. M39old]MCG5547035.1 type II toxin-antitoxin system HicA family toxin [Halorhodospira sp. M38]